MRLRLFCAGLALLGAGCSDAATAPYRATSAPAPSGLAVALNTIPGYEAPPPAYASITADGDSVIATAPLGASGCVDYTAAAGVADGDLVVTITTSFPDTPRACTMDARIETFRAVVRPAPKGSYDVVLRDRVQRQAGSPSFDERELARRPVILR